MWRPCRRQETKRLKICKNAGSCEHCKPSGDITTGPRSQRLQIADWPQSAPWLQIRMLHFVFQIFREKRAQPKFLQRFFGKKEKKKKQVRHWGAEQLLLSASCLYACSTSQTLCNQIVLLVSSPIFTQVVVVVNCRLPTQNLCFVVITTHAQCNPPFTLLNKTQLVWAPASKDTADSPLNQSVSMHNWRPCYKLVPGILCWSGRPEH